MLEGILEKLLSNYFGDLFENLDKNKLSVAVCLYNIIYISALVRKCSLRRSFFKQEVFG